MKNIKQFWQTFLNLKESLSIENADHHAMDSLLNALGKIDKRLYYHIGHKDDSIDLILSAEGHPDLMEVLENLLEKAPKIKGWGVVVTYDALALFGKRNRELYPNTINGDVLYKMTCEGDKPWIARPIDFAVVFPDEDLADQFLKEVQDNSIKGEVSPYDGAEGYTYQVELTVDAFPTIALIDTFEQRLEEISKKYQGRNDGWGCFNLKDLS